MTETIIQTRFWTQDWRVEVTDPLKFPLTALPVWFSFFAGSPALYPVRVSAGMDRRDNLGIQCP